MAEGSGYEQFPVKWKYSLVLDGRASCATTGGAALKSGRTPSPGAGVSSTSPSWNFSIPEQILGHRPRWLLRAGYNADGDGGKEGAGWRIILIAAHPVYTSGRLICLRSGRTGLLRSPNCANSAL